MAYLLVPLGVSTTEVTVWVGVMNESFSPARLVLESKLGQHPIDPAKWEKWESDDGRNRVNYQRVTISGLQARTTYSPRLRVGGEVKSNAELTTLPDRLPVPGEKPFTVLLGSCFCKAEDEEGKVGNTYFHIPGGARPDVKILSGDQVYLDSPWHHYLKHTHSAAELQAEFFKNYLDTWTQTTGFQRLLQGGANYFCPDDHELWNNAPNRASFIRDTWPFTDHREEWYDAALSLYKVFQTPSTITPFSVGNLSFMIADTRMNRDSKEEKFMKDDDLNRVGAWINGLRGPGVLVLGQPIFSKKAGSRGHFFDWSLVDYEQYARLTHILNSSRHSIVVLTGDVHYGRVCRSTPDNMLVEVISSPMSLVDKKAAGKWEDAPKTFPAFGIPNVGRVDVETNGSFRLTDSHFTTLEFTASGAHVVMKVRVWPILKGNPIGSDFGREVNQIHLK